MKILSLLLFFLSQSIFAITLFGECYRYSEGDYDAKIGKCYIVVGKWDNAYNYQKKRHMIGASVTVCDSTPGTSKHREWAQGSSFEVTKMGEFERVSKTIDPEFGIKANDYEDEDVIVNTKMEGIFSEKEELINISDRVQDYMSDIESSFKMSGENHFILFDTSKTLYKDAIGFVNIPTNHKVTALEASCNRDVVSNITKKLPKTSSPRSPSAWRKKPKRKKFRDQRDQMRFANPEDAKNFRLISKPLSNSSLSF